MMMFYFIAANVQSLAMWRIPCYVSRDRCWVNIQKLNLYSTAGI